MIQIVEINNEVISGVLNDHKIKDLRFYTVENDDKILVLILGEDFNSVKNEMKLLKKITKKHKNTICLLFRIIKNNKKNNKRLKGKSLNVILVVYGKTLVQIKMLWLKRILLKLNGTPLSGILTQKSDEYKYGQR